MRAPSTKALQAAFKGLSAKDANLIRRLAHAVDDSEGRTGVLKKLVDAHCPATRAYVLRMHSDPYFLKLRRVSVALDAMRHILEMHSVQGLGPAGRASEGYSPPFEYLNAGDPYVTTLIYNRKTDTLRIGCYGDVVERHGQNWE